MQDILIAIHEYLTIYEFGRSSMLVSKEWYELTNIHSIQVRIKKAKEVHGNVEIQSIRNGFIDGIVESYSNVTNILPCSLSTLKFIVERYSVDLEYLSKEVLKYPSIDNIKYLRSNGDFATILSHNPSNDTIQYFMNNNALIHCEYSRKYYYRICENIYKYYDLLSSKYNIAKIFEDIIDESYHERLGLLVGIELDDVIEEQVLRSNLIAYGDESKEVTLDYVFWLLDHIPNLTHKEWYILALNHCKNTNVIFSDILVLLSTDMGILRMAATLLIYEPFNPLFDKYCGMYMDSYINNIHNMTEEDIKNDELILDEYWRVQYYILINI